MLSAEQPLHAPQWQIMKRTSLKYCVVLRAQWAERFAALNPALGTVAVMGFPSSFSLLQIHICFSAFWNCVHFSLLPFVPHLLALAKGFISLIQ